MPERVDTPEAFLALRVRLRDQHVLLVQAQAARNQADARAYALKLDLAAVRQQRDDLAAENARFKEEATTSLDARATTIETLEAENARLQSEVKRLTPRMGERGESPSVPCRCGQHRVVVSTTGNGKTTRHGWGPDDCGPKVSVR